MLNICTFILIRFDTKTIVLEKYVKQLLLYYGEILNVISF